MEKIMTNGFCELNEQEMMGTDGGGWCDFWEDVGYNAYDYDNGKTNINPFAKTVMDRLTKFLQGGDSTVGGPKDVLPDDAFRDIT